MTEPTPPILKHRSNWPSWVGLALTLIYLMGVGAYISRTGDPLALPFDKMGSFLGGVFAPIAFLWLVLGFFQQGEELRNSVDALMLQSEELRPSVEQQRSMVGLTREQIDHMKERVAEDRKTEMLRAQPTFEIVPIGHSSMGSAQRKYSFQLVNTGAPCTAVRLEVSNSPTAASVPLLPTGQSFNFSVYHAPGAWKNATGTITYSDSLGVPRCIDLAVTAYQHEIEIVMHPSKIAL